MYILFDIGGTKIRIAKTKDLKEFSDQQTIATPKDFREGIKVIKEAADKISEGEKVIGAAGGVRALNFEKTRLINHPLYPLWVNEPLKKRLEESLSAPVYLENDSALVGLGEALHGAGKNYRIVGYITISTGVGGVRVVNGKIDENAMGFEPGNQIIDLDNNRPKTLESLISGPALEDIYHQAPTLITDPIIWEGVARILAYGLNNTLVHWSPDIVVIGGGLVNMIPLVKVDEELKKVLKIFPKHPPLVKAILGDLGGLYGALDFLKEKLEPTEKS